MQGLSAAELSSGHVKAAAACGLVPFILDHGSDPDRILGEAGLTEHVFDNPNAEIPLARYVAMMENAAQATGNTMFGLNFGLQFPPAGHGTIGELALAAPSIGAALQAFMDFFPLHQGDTEARCVQDGHLLRLEYRILDSRIWSRRQDAELTIGMLVNLLGHAYGNRLAIEEICFEHPRLERVRAYENAVSAPVYFGARTNAVTIRAAGLERPMPAANARRFAALAAELRGAMPRPANISLQTQVCGEIRRLLPEGYPPVDTVAETFGLARWTLQRRLADHGVSFSECVDNVRARLATLYLAEPHLSISTISDLLGYSEISAFSRAFRRWFGASPDNIRKENSRVNKNIGCNLSAYPGRQR